MLVASDMCLGLGAMPWTQRVHDNSSMRLHDNSIYVLKFTMIPC